VSKEEFPFSMKVLIAGICGFVGSVLARRLQKDLPRILEKQNRLQMSHVLFRCPRINHQGSSLFSMGHRRTQRCFEQKAPKVSKN
jgi:hypothetical protein